MGRSSSQRLSVGDQPLSFLGLSLGLSQRFSFSGFLLDGCKHPAYCSPRGKEASMLPSLPGPTISHLHKAGSAL